MSTRAEKALKAQKDKHHSILRELVQEPSNKTCADCLAKGPRWASWNLGIFMCIRCAGIHRNLGVHISKCKSIDLDSWTVEQLENVLKWGNKRAALYYECYLPKDFTRPQGNQAVETFIRNKYEKKLYMKKDGEPEYIEHRLMDKLRGVPTTEKENKPQSRKKEVKPTEDKAADKKTILNIAKKAPEVTGVVEEPAKLQVTQTAKSSSMNDLFSLNDAPAPAAAAAPAQPVQSSVTTDDLLNFGAFSDPVPSTPAVDPTPAPKDAASTNGLESMNTVETSKSTKESILSLYSTGNTSQQQKMYGVPGGVYMQPQQMQQQQQQQQQQHMAQVSQNQGNMMFSGFPQQSMPNQMHQMNSQMQQMNLSQSNQQMMSGQPQQNPYMQQGGASLNQFGSSGQPAFSTPMYTSNSGMMQMNGMQFPQQQQQQQQKFQQNGGMHSNMATTNSVGNFGMNMSNNGWGNTGGQSNVMGAPRQQQPAFNYNMNTGHMMNGGGTSGFTMNNQLWN